MSNNRKGEIDWEFFWAMAGCATIVIAFVVVFGLILYRAENRKHAGVPLPKALIENYCTADIKNMKDGDKFYFKKHVMSVSEEGRCWITIEYNYDDDNYVGTLTANKDSDLMIEKKKDGYHVTVINPKVKWQKEVYMRYEDYVPVQGITTQSNIPLKDILK